MTRRRPKTSCIAAEPIIRVDVEKNFEAVPQKVLLVVHGTVLLPPAWNRDPSAGSDPGATPLKFWAKIVVETGVPASA